MFRLTIKMKSLHQIFLFSQYTSMLCKPFIIYLNRMSQDLHMMLFALSDDHTQIKHFLIMKLLLFMGSSTITHFTWQIFQRLHHQTHNPRVLSISSIVLNNCYHCCNAINHVFTIIICGCRICSSHVTLDGNPIHHPAYQWCQG